jgi:hypothetical protein
MFCKEFPREALKDIEALDTIKSPRDLAIIEWARRKITG